jgi:acetate kinase
LPPPLSEQRAIATALSDVDSLLDALDRLITKKRDIKQAAMELDQDPQDTNLITLHLGNGASVCAIRGGISVDTSMGLTPLEGLMMGSRCGDMDPAIALYLSREMGYSTHEIDDILNKQSGLLGISGVSDMRQIHQLIADGDNRAKLAHEMFCYRICKYIGSYSAILGRVDAIVFTGGIGENDAITRATIEQMMEIDTPYMTIATDEELEIALQTMELLEIDTTDQRSTDGTE